MSLSTSALILPSDVAKDTRDFLRARQLRLKPHDRSKSKVGGGCKCSWCNGSRHRAGIRGRKHHVPTATVKDKDAREPLSPIAVPLSSDKRNDNILHVVAPVVEVPLLSLLKPVKQKQVFGSDFEIVERPQRVIALDDMEEDVDEEEWEHIPNPLSPKKLPTAMKDVDAVPRKTSYAAVVKK